MLFMNLRRTRTLRVVRWALVVSIAFAAGFLLDLSLSTADRENWGRWVRSFVRSPGAAGLAAVAASIVAYAGISRQVHVARSSLAHQVESADASSWWAMFEWASERAIPAKSDDEPLPDSVSISTLEQLAETATTDVQRAACAGVISVLTSRVQPPDVESLRQTAERVYSDASVAAWEALRSYVDSSKGSPASSSAAEALIYENEVVEALTQTSVRFVGSDIRRIAAARVPYDLIAQVAGQRVAIDIKYGRSAPSVRKRAADSASRLAMDSSDYEAAIIVTPFAISETEMGASWPEQVSVVQWRSDTDTSKLLRALESAAAKGAAGRA